MIAAFWEALATNSLLLRALIVGWVSSVLAGVLGTYIVAKRLESLSGSISHVVLAGLSGSLYCHRVLGWPLAHPLLGALIAALASALVIGLIHLRSGEHQGGLIAASWPLGMAVGYVFIYLTPGSNLELTNYLFGNILWTSRSDIWALLILDGLVFAVIGIFFKQLRAICCDEEQAQLQGIATGPLYLLLLCLIAAGIVVMTYIVGTILVLTLLTIPPLIASRWTSGLGAMMILAGGLSALFCTAGLYLSFIADLPTGPLISITAGCAQGASLLMLKRKWN